MMVGNKASQGTIGQRGRRADENLFMLATSHRNDSTETVRVKILFLGTGAGDAFHVGDSSSDDGYIPRARKLGGKNLRGPASILLEPDIRIDYGEDRALERLGLDERPVQYLVITHGHGDHLQPKGILAFAARQEDGIDVYGNNMVIDAIEFAATHEWDAGAGRFHSRESDAEVRLHRVLPGDTFSVSDATFTALPANHFIDKVDMIPAQQALNYVIERGGKTLFYGLDSSYPLPEAMQQLRGYRFNAAVLDATFGDMEIDLTGSGHMNFAIVEELVAELRGYGTITDDTVIILSHLSLEHVPPHDDIADEMAARGLQLPYDGLRLEL